MRGFWMDCRHNRNYPENGHLGTLSRRRLAVWNSGNSRLRTMLAITSFIIRYLDWQAHNRRLGQLSAMASIGLSGVLLNGIPGP